jgi:hypothetical protein
MATAGTERSTPMFTNPMFEWWLESLEARRQLSAAAPASTADASPSISSTADTTTSTPTAAEPSATDADGTTILSTPAGQYAGTFATGAFPTADDAFVTEWSLPPP